MVTQSCFRFLSDKYAALADLDNVFGGGSGVSWDGQTGAGGGGGGGGKSLLATKRVQ